MPFDPHQPLRLLSSSKDHGALPLRTSGYFLRRRPLAGVGTIVQLERQKMSRPFACRCTVSIRYPPVGSIKWSPSHRFADQNVVASCALVTTGALPLERDRRGMPRSTGHARIAASCANRDGSRPSGTGMRRSRPSERGGTNQMPIQGPIPIPKQPSSAKAVFRLVLDCRALRP
jgi:hypothetical protein